MKHIEKTAKVPAKILIHNFFIRTPNFPLSLNILKRFRI